MLSSGAGYSLWIIYKSFSCTLGSQSYIEDLKSPVVPFAYWSDCIHMSTSSSTEKRLSCCSRCHRDYGMTHDRLTRLVNSLIAVTQKSLLLINLFCRFFTKTRFRINATPILLMAAALWLLMSRNCLWAPFNVSAFAFVHTFSWTTTCARAVTVLCVFLTFVTRSWADALECFVHELLQRCTPAVLCGAHKGAFTVAACCHCAGSAWGLCRWSVGLLCASQWQWWICCLLSNPHRLSQCVRVCVYFW